MAWAEKSDLVGAPSGLERAERTEASWLRSAWSASEAWWVLGHAVAWGCGHGMGTHGDVGDVDEADVLVAVLGDLLLLSHPSALVLGRGLDETETSSLGGTGRRDGGNQAGRAGKKGEEGRSTHVVR